MEVRIWKKNGHPVDYSGKMAISALAILLLEKGVRLGLIKKSGGLYFRELIKDGRIVGSVSYRTDEEDEFISALGVAGRVKRERMKRKERRRIVVKAQLN